MSGIYIPGMEMPEGGYACPLFDDYGRCAIVGERCGDCVNGRPSFCPLLPVPDHGDLIDRDALIAQYSGNIFTAKTDYAEGLRDIIADIQYAPVIIPADREVEE